MDSVVQNCEDLTDQDAVLIENIKDSMGVLADLSRADVLMYCLRDHDRALVVAQARPHSILPVHSELHVGQIIGVIDQPAVMRTLITGRKSSTEVSAKNGSRQGTTQSAPVVQETYPIRGTDDRVIGAVSIETNLIERERHRRRSKVFRRALKQFQAAALTGQLAGADRMTPFAEHDGVMVIDAQHRIQYVSGIATSLYRKLGYVGNLLKRRIEDLTLDDYSLPLEAMKLGQCVEGEVQVGGDLVWAKKAIPLFSRSSGLRRLLPARGLALRKEGALITIHDETDRRRQEEELRVQAAMVQEIHHRVKNNMQTIASLLRLQSRRANSDQLRRSLQESINRIMSVAVIHEFLSNQDARVINIRDVGQRIINQVREGVLDREKDIRLELKGPNIYLPTQPATVCALVINELIQNSLEHAYEAQGGGTVTVNLQDDGEQVTVSVDDDGEGLPEDFDLIQTSSLGLQIIRTLAEGDLRGSFQLLERDKGVSAVVTFPKQSQGGR